MKDPEEIEELSLIAIKILNNYAGNLRSACSETNRNVIRKHVDLPYEEGELEGTAFVESFVDTLKALKEVIPQASHYITTNILSTALNAVVEEGGDTIVSSKYCPLEQGHDKELRSENHIPSSLYLQLVHQLEEAYGEEL